MHHCWINIDVPKITYKESPFQQMIWQSLTDQAIFLEARFVFLVVGSRHKLNSLEITASEIRRGVRKTS